MFQLNSDNEIQINNHKDTLCTFTLMEIQVNSFCCTKQIRYDVELYIILKRIKNLQLELRLEVCLESTLRLSFSSSL